MEDLYLKSFISLADLFNKNQHNLYLVGGTVRDYLFSLPLEDMDAVTDATPEEMKSFIGDADYTFSRFGSVKYKINNIKFDITTLRSESEYKDSRHPAVIKFVKDLSIDVKRRDFTINALYLDKNLQVIDLVDGLKDIKSKTLTVIGDADKRIKEDPLRIVRAIRFALDYDLSFDDELLKAIINNIDLLEKINLAKIKMDLKKMKTTDKEKINNIFNKCHFIKYLGVLE